VGGTEQRDTKVKYLVELKTIVEGWVAKVMEGKNVPRQTEYPLEREKKKKHNEFCVQKEVCSLGEGSAQRSKTGEKNGG